MQLLTHETQLFLPISQPPFADHISTLYCLHRLKCIPGEREWRAELLPVRRGFAGWGGIEMLSPDGSLHPPLLFVCGNRMFGASPTDTRAQQPPEILPVTGNVPHVQCHCQWEGLRQGLGEPRQQPNRRDLPHARAGGLLTLTHSSPDVAHRRQAGKKETSANQHGDRDLQEGKHQEGEVKVTFHHVKTQICSPQLRDHKLRSTALCITDSAEKVDGKAPRNYPAVLIYYFIFLVSAIQLSNALYHY